MKFNVAPKRSLTRFVQPMVQTLKGSQFTIIETANIHISVAETREFFAVLLKRIT